MVGTSVRAIEMLPTFGDIDHIHLPALIVQHADGDQSLQLKAQDTTYIDNAQYKETVIATKDLVHPFYVTIHVRQWKDVAITETWYEISHTEKKPVRLQRFDSGYLPLENGDLYLVHLHGNWAGEAVPTVERITRGV